MSTRPLYAILDIETTGGSPRDQKITEIAVFVYDGEKVVRQFDSLINPEMTIPPFIVNLTGISNELVESAPRFHEIAKPLLEILEGTIFVAHNAQFDFSFVREEYKSLGYKIDMDKICTVNLSRALIPDMDSYSLGPLCKSLNITNKNHHRAAGDAEATLELFKILQQQQGFEQAKQKAQLNPLTSLGLSKKLTDDLDELPTSPGVFYIKDEKGEILFIARGSNIRRKVLQILRNNKSRKLIKLRSVIHEIDFIETGSSLIAQLREVQEINKHTPPYNRKSNKNKYPYYITNRVDTNGLLRLEVKYDEQSTHSFGFKALDEAQLALKRIGNDHKLCPTLVGNGKSHKPCLHHKLNSCKGACEGNEDKKDYNLRVNKALDTLPKGIDSVLIIDKGRVATEKSALLIKDGELIGWNYFEPEFLNSTDDLIGQIRKTSSVPNILSIVASYLAKNNVEKTIKL